MNAAKLSAVVCLCLLSAPVFAGRVPRSKHVWVITEENRSYESVIGSSYMPYYNYLANRYALSANYYSNLHGSLSALMRLVAGQNVTSNSNTTS
jgi:hypothetical protein